MPRQETSTEEKVTTSLKIRPSVWKKAKIKAIEKDRELSELVEAAIEKWLKEEDEIDRKQQR